MQCYRLGTQVKEDEMLLLVERELALATHQCAKRDGRSTIVRRVPTCVDASYVRIAPVLMPSVGMQTNCMHEAQLAHSRHQADNSVLKQRLRFVSLA